MMTTFAALLGAMPLAVTTGNGAEMRQPLGISIVGGLLLSQILTLYTTPVVYLYLDRFRVWMQHVAHGQAPRLIAGHDGSMPDMDSHGSCICCSGRRCCLLACACAVGPNYHRPDAPVAPRLKENQGWKPATPATDRRGPALVVDLRRSVARQLERQVVVSNQNAQGSGGGLPLRGGRESAWTAATVPDHLGHRRRDTRSGGGSGCHPGRHHRHRAPR